MPLFKVRDVLENKKSDPFLLSPPLPPSNKESAQKKNKAEEQERQQALKRNVEVTAHKEVNLPHLQ